MREAGGGGSIVHVDTYGNLITNLAPGARFVRAGGQRVAVRRTFEDVSSGELVAYVGSAGTIELAVRDGSAAAVLGIARGAAVEPA
jgi:S-adenosylmethionine hydrolase